MKLTIEHLTPYLPYKLKYIDKDSGETTTMRTISAEINLIDLGWGNAHELKEFKPILRPLSDLTKEIEHNKISRTWCNKDDKVTPSELLKRCSLLSIREDGHFSEDNGDGTCTGYLYGGASYSTIELLLSWHFDVFGLIDKGLAIDINTLDL